MAAFAVFNIHGPSGRYVHPDTITVDQEGRVRFTDPSEIRALLSFEDEELDQLGYPWEDESDD